VASDRGLDHKASPAAVRRSIRSKKTIQRGAIWIDGRRRSLLCSVRDVHMSGALIIIDPSICLSDKFFLCLSGATGYILCNVVWRGIDEIAVIFLSRHENINFKKLPY
jgi:hypothetical protein